MDRRDQRGPYQAPDLVQRAFRATAPNQRRVADITYVPTAAGFLYLAIVLDVFSRRIIGWSMQDTLHTTVMLDALEMAATQRRATDVIHHSDQGSPPNTDPSRSASAVSSSACAPPWARATMRTSTRWPRAFFSTLECECLAKRRFTSHAHARLVLFRYIEGWYNPHRRHSALGQRSPLAFEQHHAVPSLAA